MEKIEDKVEEERAIRSKIVSKVRKNISVESEHLREYYDIISEGNVLEDRIDKTLMLIKSAGVVLD